MNRFLNHFKNNYLLIVIQLLILGIFVYRVLQGNSDAALFLPELTEKDNLMGNYWFLLTKTSFYRPALFLVVPVVGIFIRHKIGWILQQAYFYFLLTNGTFSIRENIATNPSQSWTILFVLIIIVLFIFVMNLK
ncbi:hypothetical protein [Aquimarina brevivitae]|uniref:DoxX-like protein n=1 Tax=Aquimarina brevivitae TaxID=323412 RepID=A0A4Q7P123_9FLAO|nr:hypothetical protein [Aquimarina brevivitae]RZS93384.1 hypothetical protein EV197_1962 [Aquimarina brevivitae]